MACQAGTWPRNCRRTIRACRLFSAAATARKASSAKDRAGPGQMFLSKPYHPADLVQAVRAALDNAACAERPRPRQPSTARHEHRASHSKTGRLHPQQPQSPAGICGRRRAGLLQRRRAASGPGPGPRGRGFHSARRQQDHRSGMPVDGRKQNEPAHGHARSTLFPGPSFPLPSATPSIVT